MEDTETGTRRGRATSADVLAARQECHLALRIAALHIELYRLQHAAADAPPDLFTGRFESVLHVRTYVLDVVKHIKASLLCERALRPAVEGHRGRATYRIAVANATWALDMLGRDPALVRFLALGARSGPERLRACCRTIGRLLGANLGA